MSPVTWKKVFLSANFALWGLLLLGLVVRNILNPDRLVCFWDYQRAALQWIQGINIYDYRVNDGFLYSPSAAIFLIPFSIFPPPFARTFWQLFLAVTLLVSFTVFLKYGPSLNRLSIQNRLLAFLLLLPLTLGNFDQSQANIVITGLIMIAVSAANLGRWSLAALAIAGAFYWKLYPIVVGMLLILVAPKQMTWRLLLAILVIGLIPFLCQKPSYVLEQYRLWFATRAQDNRLLYPLHEAPLDLWFVLVRWAHLPISQTAYYVLQILSGAAIASFCIVGWFRNWLKERILGGVFFFACGWMILFGPATELVTYLLVAPAAVFGILESMSAPSSKISRFFALCAYLFLLLGVMQQAFCPDLRLQVPSVRLLSPLGAICIFGYAISHYCRSARRNPVTQFVDPPELIKPVS